VLERFVTTLNCVDVSFVPDQLLDQLPLLSQIGSTRVGGVDLNKPRIRILAGVRSPRLGRKPAHWTAIDRDYETLRIGMRALFADLGIAA
jgi:hypothetical protein